MTSFKFLYWVGLLICLTKHYGLFLQKLFVKISKMLDLKYFHFHDFQKVVGEFELQNLNFFLN
jgi:hypothetical protein